MAQLVQVLLPLHGVLILLQQPISSGISGAVDGKEVAQAFLSFKLDRLAIGTHLKPLVS